MLRKSDISRLLLQIMIFGSWVWFEHSSILYMLYHKEHYNQISVTDVIKKEKAKVFGRWYWLQAICEKPDEHYYQMYS